MKTFTYQITDPIGIHARPAGMLVKAAGGFQSKITIAANGKSSDARRLMSLMGMGVKSGDTVTVTVEGADEDTAAAAIEAFFREKL